LQGAEINAAKDVLADAATGLAHGAEAASQAADSAKRTFGENGAGDALPTMAVPQGRIALVDALVGLKLAASKGEAKRLIRGGGARVDGEAIGQEDAIVEVGGAPVRVSAGKKQHGVLTR